MTALARVNKLQKISEFTGANAFVTQVQGRTKHRVKATLSITRGLRCLALQKLLALPADDPNEPLELVLRDSEHSAMFAHAVYAYNVDPWRPLVINMDPASSDAARSNGVEDGVVAVTLHEDGTPATGAQDVIFEVWPINKVPTRDEWATVRSKLAIRSPNDAPVDEDTPGGPKLFLNIRDAEKYIRQLYYSDKHPAYLREEPVNHKRAYTAINIAPRHVKGTDLEDSSISLEQIRGYGYKGLKKASLTPRADALDPVMYPVVEIPFRQANRRQVETARENRLRRLRHEVASRVGSKRLPAPHQEQPRPKHRAATAPKEEQPGPAQIEPPRQKRTYKKRTSCRERRGSELTVGIYTTAAENEERAYRAALADASLEHARVLHTVLEGLIADQYC